MPKGITQKTGSAPIVKQGHTASSKHGADPSARVVGRPEARPLSAK